MENKMKKAFIAPDVIISIITGKKEASEFLDVKEFELFTSDFALYEAIVSIKKDELVMESFVDFLYKVKVISSPKIRDDIDRINHLRTTAKLKEI